ncbi:folate-binding protein YgfZ [cf. Phormidesmis sp. LEGE 11477]|uniref:CAF17-like 4Fe-4S cluster assembly/insertion protein YgfZ n=1 Tax=cf. Phormidesmis sp. LEGE 11477 TaxID=1828680 RepID=UPI00187EE0A1|nr:folate-binding protein YgfZ [cf. Phormidesmis sp. LEGE 11477]MBE9061583.1 folate-binding protein YgfZ [cf. Phormidesmis sp. LEGE 11477]
MATFFDRSHWGRIRLTGADRARFLHNQTTNNIEQLSATEGCHSVFVTSTGRTIDLATVYALEASLLVIVSPGMGKQIYDWMDKYIFFSDEVTLTDESDETFLFTVVGEGCDELARSLGADKLVGKSAFTHQAIADDIHIACDAELAIPGYTIWGPVAKADTLKQSILSAGIVTGTEAEWERLRIQQGRPVPNKELTDDNNPLEAGLWHSISFEKGCYIGQETIARLNTYKGVKQRLWGLTIERSASEDVAGADIVLDGKTVGKLTSATDTEAGFFGLGYIRTKAGGQGLAVEIAGAQAKVVPVPFVQHEYYESAKPDS